MAELTQAQRQSLDQMISGTFNSLGASPSYMSPNTSVSDMYAGIYPPAKQQAPQQTYQPGMLGRGQPSPVGSPYLTAEERTLLQQQIADSQKLQNPTLDITVPYSEPTQYANARWGAALPQGQPTSGWDANDPMTLLANQNAAAFMASPDKANLDARADPNSPLMAYSSSGGSAPAASAAQRPLTPSQQYAITNAMSQLNAKNAQSGMTGTGTDGYVYQNGVNVGSTRPAGMSAAEQYALANGNTYQKPSSNGSNPNYAHEQRIKKQGRADWVAAHPGETPSWVKRWEAAHPGINREDGKK